MGMNCSFCACATLIAPAIATAAINDFAFMLFPSRTTFWSQVLP
jgi:hypothetical protein